MNSKLDILLALHRLNHISYETWYAMCHRRGRAERLRALAMLLDAGLVREEKRDLFQVAPGNPYVAAWFL